MSLAANTTKVYHGHSNAVNTLHSGVPSTRFDVYVLLPHTLNGSDDTNIRAQIALMWETILLNHYKIKTLGVRNADLWSHVLLTVIPGVLGESFLVIVCCLLIVEQPGQFILGYREEYCLISRNSR